MNECKLLHWHLLTSHMYVDTYVASFHVFGLTFYRLYGIVSPVCFQHWWRGVMLLVCRQAHVLQGLVDEFNLCLQVQQVALDFVVHGSI